MSADLDAPEHAAPPARASRPPDGADAVDPKHPWLGLASFTEETRSYFHGRGEEVAELARRVQRKLLTVLFGQSGLGKTSILRAGIVPRLRPEGYCPVYVRIDYSPESPPPSEQIKEAIFRATQESGTWTQPGSAVAGESLWEFLHHRDDALRDGAGKPLVPLLIFDQFEEIFTLAQADDAGRKRAAQFIEDLADLVENRPPKALEARLETDETLIERFDFSRVDYRILIALREDYLAHLEGVKGAMPSITQNRMRLARMNGQQALAAVMKPGGKLVSQEVAEAIVRFIAGGSELRNAEVEPSLLSLICRELNNARIAQGRAEISADLLAGSHETILSEFYERALADQPAAVRKVIEDQLLTESGFRENVAEERLAKALADAGAAPGTIATLVNRRLLRIEERLDIRRVELTHDVLCGVVRASRQLRLEREALEEAERQLQAQRAREAATHQALVRTRWIATACAVLALGAIVSAFFAVQSSQRAREAEASADRTRVLAEKARVEAEKLVVYLLDDFLLELEPVGRLDIVGDLSRRAIAYYDGLPKELRTPETERNRALALMRLGFVLRTQSKLEDAGKVLQESVNVLARLRREGDRSEGAAIGHALALTYLGRVHDSQGNITKALPLVEEADRIVAPLASAGSPSVPLRRAYGAVTNYLGFLFNRTAQYDKAIAMLQKTRETFREIDGLRLNDLASAAGYAEATGWLMDAFDSANRAQDARRVGEQAIKVASAVLEKQPGHMQALRSRALIANGLARGATFNLAPRRGLDFAAIAIRDWDDLVRADPGNTIAWGNLGVSMGFRSLALGLLGRNRDSAVHLLATKDLRRRPGAEASQYLTWLAGFHAGFAAPALGELGDRAGAAAALADHRALFGVWLAKSAPDTFLRRMAPEWGARFEAMAAEPNGDYAAMREVSAASIERLRKFEVVHAGQAEGRNELLRAALSNLARANLALRDYAAVERPAREAIEVQARRPRESVYTALEGADDRVVLAIALSRQGRLPEAREALAPALALHRKLQPIGAEDVGFQQQRAWGLYASALVAPETAAAALREAVGILDTLPGDAPRLIGVSRLRGAIVEARRQSP